MMMTMMNALLRGLSLSDSPSGSSSTPSPPTALVAASTPSPTTAIPTNEDIIVLSSSSSDTKGSRFNLAQHVPKHWRDAIDVDGKIAWNPRNALLVKMFGLERGSAMVFHVGGTLLRLLVWEGLGCVFLVVTFLGYFQWVSKEVMIVSVVASCAWIVVSASAVADLAIARRIVLLDTFAIANLWLMVLHCVSFLCVLDWDYRGACHFPTMVGSILLMSCADSYPHGIRNGTIPLAAAFLAVLVTLLVCVNLGVFPKQNPTAVLYTVTGLGNLPLTVSAYGTFNDATIALILMNANEVRWRWFYRTTGRLRTVTINLDGKDLPGGIDFSYLRRYF